MAKLYSINLGGGGTTLIVANVGSLPASGTQGQFALVTSDNTVYIWDGSAWQLVGGQGNLLGHAGVQAITNGANTVSVTFASAMPNTNYAITASIENTTDVDPIALIVIATTKQTTGFIATLNAPTDSGNYLLNWKVARNV